MRDETERGCLLKTFLKVQVQAVHVCFLYFFWLSRVMVFGLANVLSVSSPYWGETQLLLLLTLF